MTTRVDPEARGSSVELCSLAMDATAPRRSAEATCQTLDPRWPETTPDDPRRPELETEVAWVSVYVWVHGGVTALNGSHTGTQNCTQPRYFLHGWHESLNLEDPDLELWTTSPRDTFWASTCSIASRISTLGVRGLLGGLCDAQGGKGARWEDLCGSPEEGGIICKEGPPPRASPTQPKKE